jgi:hypothetical protein
LATVPQSNAVRSRLKRERARARAALATVEASAAVAAPPVGGAEAGVRDFLGLALAWTDAQETATGQGLGLNVAEALDQVKEETDDSNLRRFSDREGIAGAFRSADNHARRQALGMIQAATVELRAGTATVTTIRTGLKAARALAKYRARFDASAVDLYLAVALSGFNVNRGYAPEGTTPCRCSDHAEPHVFADHQNWEELVTENAGDLGPEDAFESFDD